jgi:hypothetical protein
MAFVDNRPAATALRTLSNMIDNSPRVQRQRAFIDNLNGMQMQVAPARQGGAAIQLARAKVTPPVLPVDFAILEAAINPIDVEINELTNVDTAEVVNGFIDMTDVIRWRGNFDVNIATLRGLNTGAATFTKDQISARNNPIVNAIYAVVVTLGNLRNALNNSLEEYNGYAQRKSEMEKFKSERTEFESTKGSEAELKKGGASSSASTSYESPYKPNIGKYDNELEGAIVLVDGPYVVVMEHYQLKHNPDIGVLSAGGPFKGKKGSALAGGWAAHRDTYAPAILAHAKTFIPGMGKQTNLILKKARLADIDAYISITVDGKDWVINYHGNPPD